MSNTNPPPPPVGEYRLFDRVLGPLTAGSYKIEIEQGFDSEQGSVSKFFDVTGPRWGLEATEVHAVFPPRNEQNATTDCYVPFITLQRRSLPWERLVLLNGETPQDFRSYNQMKYNEDWNDSRKYPWVALLVFTEDELTHGGALGIYKGDEGLCLVNSKNSIPGVFSHWSQSKRDGFGIDSSMDEMIVDAVRVDSSVLRSIAPRFEELKLLSHARQVNPQDKEQCGSDEDGWFSIVMSNRVLKPDQTYHACLVSLEGRLSENILPTNPAIERKVATAKLQSKHVTSALMASVGLPSFGKKASEKAGKQVVKEAKSPSKVKTFTNLVLLHHWTFNSSQTNGDFQARMENLNVRVESSTRNGISSGDTIPISDVDSQRDTIEPMLLGTDSVPGMTANSYLSTEMHGSDGLSEDVLYRGPLVAFSEQRDIKENPYANSDAALAIISELAIWDISHASAFELGRLLALGDGKFMKAMKSWIANDIRQEQREEVEMKIEEKGFSIPALNQRLKSIKEESSIRMVRESRLKLSISIPEISKEDLGANLEDNYPHIATEIGGGNNGQS